MSALFDFKGYSNFVLAEKIESILSTKLDLNRFLTADYSLSTEKGLIKKIHTYTGSGEIDTLARGDGNTHFIDAEFTERVYEVERSQGQTRYYDCDVMADPTLIDAKVKILAESMVNDWTSKAVAEMDKSENLSALTAWNFDAFVDAVSKFPEEEGELFCLINPAQQAAIRKNLKDDLKYVEAFSRKGFIGAVCNVPIYVSKAVPEGRAFMGKRDAVTAFIKRDISVEQDRNIDTKLNNIVASRYTVIALTNEDHMVVMGEAPATACAVVTYVKADPTIAGTCSTNASKVVVYKNGKEVGTATLSSGSWTIEASENLVAGDVIKAIAYEAKKLPSIAKVTVAD